MISEKIKKQRELKKWSIKKLATEADVSNAYISLLETHKAKNPSIKVLKKIADALEMQPIELIK
ncbi:MAG: helix-turn-helix transcriptional regulator [Paludibacteraceae bacterium]|nr:helix-turn-helix transcriptional regulator [Paludibacteraceae bacterium]